VIPIPVYSQALNNDNLLRAYDKCPKLTSNLESFYASDAFFAKSGETAPLMNELSALIGEPVELRNFFNIYDLLNLQKLEPDAVGSHVPQLESAMWDRVLAVANWLETVKFSPDVAGSLCGGSLLADVVQHVHLVNVPSVFPICSLNLP
jgi:hypothetical protein